MPALRRSPARAVASSVRANLRDLCAEHVTLGLNDVDLRRGSSGVAILRHLARALGGGDLGLHEVCLLSRRLEAVPVPIHLCCSRARSAASFAVASADDCTCMFWNVGTSMRHCRPTPALYTADWFWKPVALVKRWVNWPFTTGTRARREAVASLPAASASRSAALMVGSGTCGLRTSSPPLRRAGHRWAARCRQAARGTTPCSGSGGWSTRATRRQRASAGCGRARRGHASARARWRLRRRRESR